MSYKFGTSHISDHQHQLLARAREANTGEAGASTLSQLLQQSDIQSGKESISPEWLKLCRRLLEPDNGKTHAKGLRHFIKIAKNMVGHSPGAEAIDPDRSRLAFLLGAGASRPEPTCIPTVNELLPDLLGRARLQDRDDLTHLADFCDRSGIRHIEDLLTAAQLSSYCSRHPEVLRLVNFLLYGERLNGDSRHASSYGSTPRHANKATRGPSDNGASVAFLADTLQLLFGLISGRMLPAPPNNAHAAIASYCLTRPGASVVTTNYDCCIDRALQEQGACSNYRVDFSNQIEPELYGVPLIPLLKLHGSLNWFYCDTCQDAHLVPIENAVQSFLAHPSQRIPYPVIGHCNGCNGLRRPLLVPPQALKFDVGPPLNPLIEAATDAFTQADVIVAVGFSFADSDVHITRALTRAMKANRGSRLVVIDPDFEVSERIVRKLSVRIAEFDRSRVVKIVQSCTEVLPSFLAGDYFGLSETAESRMVEGLVQPDMPLIG